MANIKIPTVKIGQIWVDADKRCQYIPRLITISIINPLTDKVIGQSYRVMRKFPLQLHEISRQVQILTRRFNGKSNTYVYAGEIIGHQIELDPKFIWPYSQTSSLFGILPPRI